MRNRSFNPRDFNKIQFFAVLQFYIKLQMFFTLFNFEIKSQNIHKINLNYISLTFYFITSVLFQEIAFI